MVHTRLIPFVFVVVVGGCSGTPATPADAGKDSSQLPLDAAADANGDGSMMANNCGSCPAACYQNQCAKRLFASSRTYDGAAVQSTKHADDECGAMAKAAGLTGFWQAWISDELGSSPATRFGAPYNGPYVLAKSTDIRIVKTAAYFSKGSLEHAIDQDENGGPVAGFAWTQTDPYGDAFPAGLMGDACVNWTSAETAKAAIVFLISTDFGPASNRYCDDTGRLYCFEQ